MTLETAFSASLGLGRGCRVSVNRYPWYPGDDADVEFNRGGG